HHGIDGVVRVEPDVAAQPSQHLPHDRDIGDPGNIGDHAAPGGEQRGGHQLQGRVLGADDVYGARQPGGTADPDDVDVVDRRVTGVAGTHHRGPAGCRLRPC